MIADPKQEMLAQQMSAQPGTASSAFNNTAAERPVTDPESEQAFVAKLLTLNEMILDDIGQLFSSHPLETAVELAKKNWPQYRFITCSENDMGEKPAYKEYQGFSFFLIAASLGCASLTHEPHKAVGIIIAEHDDDE